MVFRRLEQLNNIIVNCTCTTAEDVLDVDEALSVLKTLLLDMNRSKGMAYIIGNGGSSGIASHFCNDLIKGLKIPANTLVDSNVVTCLANDYGYENCFSEALKVNMKQQDLLVAISSSGNSRNILNAVRVAKNKKAKVVTLSGFDAENPLRQLGYINFWLDRRDYGLVEMGHFFILHSLVDCFKAINSKMNVEVLIDNEQQN